MRKQTILIAAVLALAITDYASVAHAAGAVRGTKETITFEGLAKRTQGNPVPSGYDGFNWSNIGAIGKKIAKEDPGTKAVIDARVVAINSNSANGSEGAFSTVSGVFTLKNGHFAAACNTGLAVTFSGYRRGVLVGTKELSLDPVNTFIRFDDTFRRIDTVVIDGSGGTGKCAEVAFDDVLARLN
jgi:hypothetical protein